MDTYNPLEERIISRLRDNYTRRLNHRFTVDEKNGLLACETDQQAGIIELNEDYACAFRMEPVYAESAEELAGKVADAGGKVYREMTVCGSQPLASLLTLSLDALEQSVLQSAIADTASHSNTYGIAMAGGDVRFNDSKRQDIAASLLTIGLVDNAARLNSSCHCEGNPVFMIGAPESEKPSIPANAFIMRSLYELICDLHDDGAIVAVQNIDDGGIAVACANMVASGTNGIELNVETLGGEEKLAEFIPDKLMIILKVEFGKKLVKACRKWNMRSVQIGVTTGEHKLVILKGQTPVVDLPASALSTPDDDLPENDVAFTSAARATSSSIEAPVPNEHKDVVKFLMTCPNLLSQQWIFEQFDSTIGTNNLSTNFISDAPVLQIKGTQHALAASACQGVTDISEYPESVNLVVAESLRKVVCSGGVPYALTGCLNYSGDMDEQILHAVNEHIALFCEKTGVSSSGINMNRIVAAAQPPVNHLSIGAIAFLNDKHAHMTMSFKGKGDMIYMLGKSVNNLDSSEYIRNYHEIKDSPPQQVDVDVEADLLQVAQKVIVRKLVKSAHSVSKGGLFMALLESAMVRSFGFDVTVDDEIRKDAFLFGESPSRIVVSVATVREADFIDFMMQTNVPFMTLGHVTREEIRIDDNSYGFISDYKKMYLGQ